MTSNSFLDSLAALVVKDHVSLGGLAPAEQALALALAHAALPADTTLTEREVNQALKAALGQSLCWLGTDHVELRRWLVDAGWLTRDGFGHAYRALPHTQLREEPAVLARTIATIDATAWVAAERQRKRDQRRVRHERWLTQQQQQAQQQQQPRRQQHHA